MTFQRKEYQETALGILKDYLEVARVHGAADGFARIIRDLGLTRTYKPLPPLTETPYLCLRIPTGGGKTYMAARSASIASNVYLEDEYPVILWLVPTNVIRQQTLETLQKPNHPNREALMDAFKGQVKVLDISEFTQIRPQDLRDRACVVVGTFASLASKTQTVARSMPITNTLNRTSLTYQQGLKDWILLRKAQKKENQNIPSAIF